MRPIWPQATSVSNLKNAQYVAVSKLSDIKVTEKFSSVTTYTEKAVWGTGGVGGSGSATLPVLEMLLSLHSKIEQNFSLQRRSAVLVCKSQNPLTSVRTGSATYHYVRAWSTYNGLDLAQTAGL